MNSPSLPYFPTLSREGQIFGKKILIKICFDFFYKFCMKIFSFLRKIQRDAAINEHRPLCKVRELGYSAQTRIRGSLRGDLVHLRLYHTEFFLEWEMV